MTKKELKEIEERCNAATEGPWEEEAIDDNLWWVEGPTYLEDGFTVYYLNDSDSKFISHARTDIPKLIARIRELEESNYKLAVEVAAPGCDCFEGSLRKYVEEMPGHEEGCMYKYAEDIILKRESDEN